MRLRDLLLTEQRVVIQGLTGRAARAQLPLIRAQGTTVVAGVAPGRAGYVDGIPLFQSLAEARQATECNVSIVVVPPQRVKEACEEAIANDIHLVVVPTENVPVLDSLRLRLSRGSTRLIGPNSPGLALPGIAKLGFMPSDLLKPGGIALLSRSGTLAYELAFHLVERGLGLSIWIGIGGDPVPLTDFGEAFELIAEDPETNALAILGEIGGTGEERLAGIIQASGWDLPTHALIVGQSVTPNEPLGHAGAIAQGEAGTYEGKVRRLHEAGVTMHRTPWGLAEHLAAHFRR